MGSPLNFRDSNLWDLVNPLTADPFSDYSEYSSVVQEAAPSEYIINPALIASNSDPIPPEVLPVLEGAYALVEEQIKTALEASVSDFTQDRIEYDVFLNLV